MKTCSDAIRELQHTCDVAEDGIAGKRTRAALDLLINSDPASPWPPGDTGIEGDTDTTVHHVKASSFADPADVAAFRHCKANGGSDQHCFAKGDNGIGKWGDQTFEGSGPKCALPVEDWSRFGNAARHRKVLVKANDREVVCLLDDTMPHRANIHNGAGIDLNPDAVAALGLKVPLMTDATWQWIA